MLKRCQVLLMDWQEEYLKNVAERTDVSFSETVRVFLSAGFLWLIPIIHQEYKYHPNGKELKKLVNKATNPKIQRDEQYKILAKLYFEARKAVEYRLSKVEARKKK